MKNVAFVAMTLGCLTIVAGCSEATNKKVAETAKQTKDATSSAVKDASKKAGNGVAAAGDKAQAAMDAIGKEFSAATDKAKSALEGVSGGSELLKQITDMFASAQKSLQGVTNTETAKAAASQLGELDGKVDGISKLLKALPEKARTAVTEVIEKGIAQLKSLSEKVLAIPGVESTIKPKLDALMAKLASLKG